VKWLVGALLLIGVLWLWMLFGGETATSNEMTESSRRVLDGRWRALPEGEMTIGEMESYAAGLSDEELWQELEKSFEDWLEKNGGEGVSNSRGWRFLWRESWAKEIGSWD
jgi:hypothetical protein